MVVIIGLVALALLLGLFFLFRSMGSMGAQPSARERMQHTGKEDHSREPRATGLD